jgi:hypothetical protein
MGHTVSADVYREQCWRRAIVNRVAAVSAQSLLFRHGETRPEFASVLTPCDGHWFDDL